VNIEFIDENTVKLTESMIYKGDRPKQKIQQLGREFVDLFKTKHPSYEVESFEGPHKISNFRGVEHSKGTWILKVRKKTEDVFERVLEQKQMTKKRTTTKSATKKTKKEE